METLERKTYRPGRFPGGLLLEGHRTMSTAQPIRTAALPHQAIVPLDQQQGEVAAVTVAVGEQVLRGQPLSRTKAYVATPVHAPLSGTVVAIERRPVPPLTGTVSTCVVIESDGEDRAYDGYRPLSAYAERPHSEVIERVRAAGIAGLGGAVFPTHVKLNVPAQTLKALIMNAAESEPYITCDEVLVQERPRRIIAGAQIMMYALQVNRCLIAIGSDKPAAIEAMDEALKAEGDDRFELVAVDPIYPSGGERQLIKVLAGVEVPSRGLPPDVGFVCHNVGTAYAVRQAVIEGEPLISRIVTVTGPGIKEPANLEVRLGTPVAELIAECGGYADDVRLLAAGGPMLGVALETDEVPVVKAMNCLLALTGVELRTGERVRPCIRCGECARVCPARLLPQQLYLHARARQLDRVLEHALLDCIECGCCDLVCPSHIPLTGYFRRAKAEVWARERRRHRWFGGPVATPDGGPESED